MSNASGYPLAQLHQVTQRITDGSHFSPTPREYGQLIANVKDMKSGEIDFNTCTRISPAAYRELKATGCTIKNGNVLLSKDGTVGRVVVYRQDDEIGALSSICIIEPADQLDAAFLGQALQSEGCIRQYDNFMSGSALRRLVLRDIRSIKVPLPESAHQRSIAQILDTLDTAIRETEAIIAKLKAVKQGLLHDLLTRGIDANGELRPPQAEAPHLYKESPTGWIPKEWEVTTLRDAALPSRESFIDGDWIEAPFITSEGIRLIQTGNIGLGEFLDKGQSRRFISEASFRLLNCKWVKAGDILICRLADPIGRACVIPEYVGPAITSVDCTIFRVDEQSFSGEFVLAWVNSDASLKRAQDNAAGSTRSRISRSNLGLMPIAKPPLDEQRLIAGALHSSANHITDEAANLSKLRETKIGLMDDLLTGRIRVTPLLAETEVAHG